MTINDSFLPFCLRCDVNRIVLCGLFVSNSPSARCYQRKQRKPLGKMKLCFATLSLACMKGVYSATRTTKWCDKQAHTYSVLFCLQSINLCRVSSMFCNVVYIQYCGHHSDFNADGIRYTHNITYVICLTFTYPTQSYTT